MSSNLYKFIQKAIRRLRIQTSRLLMSFSSSLNQRKRQRMAKRNRFEDVLRLTSTPNPTIVDGGAHTGSVTNQFVRMFHNPSIHAIEPNPEFAATLREKYCNDENIFVYEKALGGQNGKGKMNLLQFPLASSLLNATALSKKYYGEKVSLDQVIDVDIARLDTLIQSEIDILKLDLQGFEMEALRGCGNLLHKIKLILLEVLFVPLYDEQPLFGDLDLFLRQNGFELFNLYDPYIHNDGQLIFADAIYRNAKLIPSG